LAKKQERYLKRKQKTKAYSEKEERRKTQSKEND
jgi:hypothetical protein